MGPSGAKDVKGAKASSECRASTARRGEGLHVLARCNRLRGSQQPWACGGAVCVAPCSGSANPRHFPQRWAAPLSCVLLAPCSIGPC